MIKELMFVDKSENIILKMIELNTIDNLLKFKIYDNNIDFNIDGKISLENKFRGQVDYKLFLVVFLKILEALSNLEKYMITSKNIYLNKEDIYLDQENNVFFMIDPYCELYYNVKDLYRNQLVDINFNLNDNLNNLFKINSYLNSEYYTIKGFKNMLIEIINTDTKCSYNEVIKIQEDTKKNTLMEGIKKYIKKIIKKI
ncbi:DUF6382 domain-containing protein [Helcococcus bovis]|uniref:DUF6382 domain-containing protein n=1 Tax=Helcococcus bovis TaxID=3153252 RepID=UPI0038B94802